jgi:hypothetical protein
MSIIRTRSQEHLAEQAEEAASLAVAQAQAAVEEEIRARLPREVLTINRRLDLQQSSVDKIHGDLSTLTDIVFQIAISLMKRPDAGRTPTSSAPSSRRLSWG